MRIYEFIDPEFQKILKLGYKRSYDALGTLLTTGFELADYDMDWTWCRFAMLPKDVRKTYQHYGKFCDCSKMKLGYQDFFVQFPKLPIITPPAFMSEARNGDIEVSPYRDFMMSLSTKVLAGDNLSKLQEIKAEPHSVCVHIRRGDYLHHRLNMMISSGYFKQAVMKIIDKTGWKDATLFIFSDDWEYTYGLDLSIPDVKIKTDYVRINDISNPVPDLELMRACRHFVCSSGGFAYTAFYMGNDDDDRILVRPQEVDFLKESESVVLQELIILEKFLKETPKHEIQEAATYIFERVMLNVEKLQGIEKELLTPRFWKVLRTIIEKSTLKLYYDDPRINSPEPPPPNTIPQHQVNDFTMNGQIPVLYWYIDERKDIFYKPRINTAEQYKEAFEKLENKTFKYYGGAMNFFYEAFEKYKLKGKSVLIWGLDGLNCEAMAIWQGAEHVYVVDYNKPVCEHEKITVFNHEELLKSGIKTDVAISFSSFEHDGLGRYGDPLNPNGDLEAMAAARNFLKDDGFMFLGVPQGQDCLAWNAHRIYGEKRLPLLLNGWKTETVFGSASDAGHTLGGSTQPLMVLRKKLGNTFNQDV